MILFDKGRLECFYLGIDLVLFIFLVLEFREFNYVDMDWEMV